MYAGIIIDKELRPVDLTVCDSLEKAAEFVTRFSSNYRVAVKQVTDRNSLIQELREAKREEDGFGIIDWSLDALSASLV